MEEKAKTTPNANLNKELRYQNETELKYLYNCQDDTECSFLAFHKSLSLASTDC